MTNYTIIIYTPQELSQSSYIQTGLFELEKMGYVNVKIKISVAKKLGRYITNNVSGKYEQTNQKYPKASYYKLIDNKTNRSVLFCVDLYDFSNQFPLIALKDCDYVFKRNFEQKHVSQLPIEHQQKVLPLNLTFWVQSEYKKGVFLFFMGALLSNLNTALKMDRFLFKKMFKTFKAQVLHQKYINKSRNLSRYEKFESAELNTIFFQTRCFLHEDEVDVKEIHLQRYRIIKLLKNQFPNEFLGGFVSSKIAHENYNDAISNVPSEPELYLDALKKAKIVIYTRGLANSPAWKMAEYLSQGKTIIAERLTAELPVPLTHGKEALFFDTDEELCENIKLVLSDKKLAEDLSTHARAYFEEHVHPAKSVKRILELMMAKDRN